MKKIIILYGFLFFFLSNMADSVKINPFEKIIIGQSVNKKDIEAYKFGNGNNVIVLIAGIHGNESNTSKTLELIIESIQNNQIKIPSDKTLCIIPKANPDGLIKDRRLNDNNVDLNRNFDSDNWQSYFYFYNILLSSGKNPFSEPETIALKKFFENLNNSNNTIVISLHSKGDSITPGNNSEINKKLSQYIFENSNYSNLNYNNTTGDLTDWLSNKLGIPSLTIEFKTKENTELEEIKNILKSVMILDFNNYFLNLNIKENNSNNNQFELNYLINNLPENIVKNITKSDKDKKNFIDLYNKLKNSEELLLLVNKNLHLPENYQPDDLIEISDKYPSNKKQQLRKIMLDDLSIMINDAKKENINFYILSAYRSYEKQMEIYNNWVKQLGEKEANRVSAVAGASQHQLGTTIDFNSLELSFAETNEGKWLSLNSYKYGFIMSYPKDMEHITGYRYEPWHYRYVGKEASYIIYQFFNNSMETFLTWYWKLKTDK